VKTPEGVEPRETNAVSLAIGFNSLPARFTDDSVGFGRIAGRSQSNGPTAVSLTLPAHRFLANDSYRQ